MQSGNPKKPGVHSLHFSPITLSLHVHTPFELHEREEDPSELQLQSALKMFLEEALKMNNYD